MSGLAGSLVAWPTDAIPLGALLLGALVLGTLPKILGFASHHQGRANLTAAAIAVVAAALSALWVTFYLRGGPRIIDATAYYLEAKLLAQGALAFPLGEPEASTMGRFLVRNASADPAQAGVLFPPGYPLVLALGFALGAPLAIGPLLAALLTLATYDLALQAANAVSLDKPRSRQAALGAAVLAAFCACLRYHTADTMSHGLAALLTTTELSLAFRIRQRGISTRLALGWGAAHGFLWATRPVTAMASLVCALAIARPRFKWSSVLTWCIAALPFVMLWLAHQKATTGSLWTSPQLSYYAASDGPAACFRYGFGQGVGCLNEHGDFVRANLPDGYGVWEATKTTARRLKMHLGDPLNAEPLGALVLLLSVWAARKRPLLPLALFLPTLAVAYAPFYFDGNYPAGGARFFAEALPVELCLLAVALVLLDRSQKARLLTGAVAATLFGFAVRGQLAHAALRDREGGSPMFDRALVADAQLVFVSTDHGFLLGFEGTDSTPRIARLRGDQHDRWLWEAVGSGPGERGSLRLEYDFGSGTLRAEPFEPPASAWIKGFGLWPPIEQHGAFATQAFWGDPCGTNLELRLTAAEPEGHVVLALPSQLRGKRIRAIFGKPGGGVPSASVLAGGAPLVSLPGSEPFSDGCKQSPIATIPHAAPLPLRLVFRMGSGDVEASLIGLRLISP